MRGFQTSLLMVLIPLSVVLVLEATHSDTLLGIVTLDIAGVALFITAMWFWKRTFKQIKKDEASNRSKQNHIIAVIDSIAVKMGVDLGSISNEDDEE